jgi:hypothetical protein
MSVFLVTGRAMWPVWASGRRVDHARALERGASRWVHPVWLGCGGDGAGWVRYTVRSVLHRSGRIETLVRQGLVSVVDLPVMGEKHGARRWAASPCGVRFSGDKRVRST